MTKAILYKAVKHEAQEYTADHGMNMSEIWSIVTGKATDIQGTPVTDDMQIFWKNICLEDYRHDVMESEVRYEQI